MLSVLDSEGIVFAESRQELYTYNTPATYVWCCIESGLSQIDTTHSYEAAFGVSAQQAGRHVSDLLGHWQRLGYLSGVNLARSARIDWTTAVAHLLTNPSLRDEFVRTPAETVRRLRVRSSCRATLLALRPADLEAQAAILDARKNAFRQAGIGVLRQDAMCNPALLRQTVSACTGTTRFSREHLYEIRGITLGIRYGSRDLEKAVHPAVAHLQVGRAQAVYASLRIIEIPSGYVLLEDVVPIGWCARLDQVAPLVKATVRHAAKSKQDYFLEIHAGVVSTGSGCLLMPAAQGSGKTTLTAGLIASGFLYFSDEVALLEESTLELRPVPLSLTVKCGSIAALRPFYPQVGELPHHTREDDEIVRYLPPPKSSLPTDMRQTQPIRWIVFPRYDPDASPGLRPITRSAALHRLMEECVAIPRPFSRPEVQGLVEWMRGQECFDLNVASLQEAVGTLTRLCR